MSRGSAAMACWYISGIRLRMRTTRSARCAPPSNSLIVSWSSMRNLRGQQLPEISMRIGIHTGLIVIGSELSSGGVQDHSIVGEAANLAARLQADAPANSVVVSGETFEIDFRDYSTMNRLDRNGSRASRALSQFTRVTKARVGTGRAYDRGRRGAPQLRWSCAILAANTVVVGIRRTRNRNVKPFSLRERRASERHGWRAK